MLRSEVHSEPKSSRQVVVDVSTTPSAIDQSKTTNEKVACLICEYGAELVALDLSAHVDLSEIGQCNDASVSRQSSRHCDERMSVISLPKLRTLNVSGCRELRSIELNCPNLEHFDASGCVKLAKIKLGSSKLVSMDLSGSAITESGLVGAIDDWTRLEKLTVEGCDKLELRAFREQYPFLCDLQLSSGYIVDAGELQNTVGRVLSMAGYAVDAVPGNLKRLLHDIIALRISQRTSIINVIRETLQNRINANQYIIDVQASNLFRLIHKLGLSEDTDFSTLASDYFCQSVVRLLHSDDYDKEAINRLFSIMREFRPSLSSVQKVNLKSMLSARLPLLRDHFCCKYGLMVDQGLIERADLIAQADIVRFIDSIDANAMSWREIVRIFSRFIEGANVQYMFDFLVPVLQTKCITESGPKSSQQLVRGRRDVVFAFLILCFIKLDAAKVEDVLKDLTMNNIASYAPKPHLTLILVECFASLDDSLRNALIPTLFKQLKKVRSRDKDGLQLIESAMSRLCEFEDDKTVCDKILKPLLDGVVSRDQRYAKLCARIIANLSNCVVGDVRSYIQDGVCNAIVANVSKYDINCQLDLVAILLKSSLSFSQAFLTEKILPQVGFAIIKNVAKKRIVTVLHLIMFKAESSALVSSIAMLCERLMEGWFAQMGHVLAAARACLGVCGYDEGTLENMVKVVSGADLISEQQLDLAEDLTGVCDKVSADFLYQLAESVVTEAIVFDDGYGIKTFVVKSFIDECNGLGLNVTPVDLLICYLTNHASVNRLDFSNVIFNARDFNAICRFLMQTRAIGQVIWNNAGLNDVCALRVIEMLRANSSIFRVEHLGNKISLNYHNHIKQCAEENERNLRSQLYSAAISGDTRAVERMVTLGLDASFSYESCLCGLEEMGLLVEDPADLAKKLNVLLSKEKGDCIYNYIFWTATGNIAWHIMHILDEKRLIINCFADEFVDCSEIWQHLSPRKYSLDIRNIYATPKQLKMFISNPSFGTYDTWQESCAVASNCCWRMFFGYATPLVVICRLSSWEHSSHYWNNDVKSLNNYLDSAMKMVGAILRNRKPIEESVVWDRLAECAQSFSGWASDLQYDMTSINDVVASFVNYDIRRLMCQDRSDMSKEVLSKVILSLFGQQESVGWDVVPYFTLIVGFAARLVVNLMHGYNIVDRKINRTLKKTDIIAKLIKFISICAEVVNTAHIARAIYEFGSCLLYELFAGGDHVNEHELGFYRSGNDLFCKTNGKSARKVCDEYLYDRLVRYFNDSNARLSTRDYNLLFLSLFGKEPFEARYERFKTEASNLCARYIATRSADLSDDDSYLFCAGYDNHAVYFVLKYVAGERVLRLDNFNELALKYHRHVSGSPGREIIYPKIIAMNSISEFSANNRLFVDYLGRAIMACWRGGDYFKQHCCVPLYAGEENARRVDDIEMSSATWPQQLKGNCVTYSSMLVLREILGEKLHGLLFNELNTEFLASSSTGYMSVLCHAKSSEDMRTRASGMGCPKKEKEVVFSTYGGKEACFKFFSSKKRAQFSRECRMISELDDSKNVAPKPVAIVDNDAEMRSVCVTDKKLYSFHDFMLIDWGVCICEIAPAFDDMLTNTFYVVSGRCVINFKVTPSSHESIAFDRVRGLEQYVAEYADSVDRTALQRRMISLIKRQLQWKIAYSLAHKIAYMHDKKLIAHNNISTTNVLLDDVLNVFLCCYKDARFFTYLSSQDRGYYSKDNDIYCFGLTLLELVIGRDLSLDSRNMSLNLDCYLDEMKGLGDEVELFGKLIDCCLRYSNRVSMSDVARFMRTKNPKVLEDVIGCEAESDLCVSTSGNLC